MRLEQVIADYGQQNGNDRPEGAPQISLGPSDVWRSRGAVP